MAVIQNKNVWKTRVAKTLEDEISEETMWCGWYSIRYNDDLDLGQENPCHVCGLLSDAWNPSLFFISRFVNTWQWNHPSLFSTLQFKHSTIPSSDSHNNSMRQHLLHLWAPPEALSSVSCTVLNGRYHIINDFGYRL